MARRLSAFYVRKLGLHVYNGVHDRGGASWVTSCRRPSVKGKRMLRAQIGWSVPVVVFGVILAGCEKQKIATTQATKAAEVLAKFTFDDLTAGEAPADFAVRQNNPSKELAVWKVLADATAPTAPNLLDVHTANANATYNLLLAEKTSFKDLDISVKVRGNAGIDDQGGGVIWRAKDENNYYVCRMNPLETNFRIYKVVEGKRKQLQSSEGITTESGKWYEVRVTMVGNQIRCYLDGKKMLDVQDDEFKEAGKIGLWTKADASSSFDDLVVMQAN